jgi:hypothetical protein
MAQVVQGLSSKCDTLHSLKPQYRRQGAGKRKREEKMPETNILLIHQDKSKLLEQMTMLTLRNSALFVCEFYF